jgi:hypothetical protein
VRGREMGRRVRGRAGGCGVARWAGGCGVGQAGAGSRDSRAAHLIRVIIIRRRRWRRSQPGAPTLPY